MPRRRLFTGNESFDRYFGFLTGTATIMYVQNQTFLDPLNLMAQWMTHDVRKNETLLLVTTYADPIVIAYYSRRRFRPVSEQFIKLGRQGRFWWIDCFTYRGFSEQERALVQVEYRERLKHLNVDPEILITPQKPDDLQSVDGLPAAVERVMSRLHGVGTIRMLMAYVDDFIDGVGCQPGLKYLRRLISLIRKFGHTLVLLMGWRSYPPEFHTACERMADQVLRWGYGDVPGLKQPCKFLQILKTTAPDERTNYLKVPYYIRRGSPTVGLPAPPQEQQRE